MRILTRLLLGIVFSALYCSLSFAAGSGAYRLEVADAAANSMGGAMVAQANTPVAVLYNPAGMTQIEQPMISVNMSFIHPVIEATQPNGHETKMQRDNFLIPGVFYSMKLSDRTAFGLGATSSWGLATEWAQDSFARFNSTRTEMTNQDYIIAGAYKLTDQWSVGAGVTIDQSNISKEKKIKNAMFGNPGEGNFKLVGDNLAAGFQVSVLYALSEQHQFGFQYSSEIRRKYHGKVHLDGLGAGIQSIYQFPGSSYETDVVSKATLPQSIDVGYCFRPTKKWTFNIDVLWMGWGAIKEEELAYPNETNAGRLAFLNDGNPANRDWHDAWSVGLGTEYKLSDRLRLRGGYFYHQTPIQEPTWDPSLPDADSHAVATGFGYDITKSLTLDMSYTAMFYEARSVNNAIGEGTLDQSIDGKYTQWSSIAQATLTYKF